MYAKHRIGVVINHLNGKSNIHTLLDGVPQYIDKVYLIAADSDLLSGFSGSRNRLTVLPKNGHKNGESLVEAYQHAITDDMDVVVLMEDTLPSSSNNWAFLLDPIVWGEADFTKSLPMKNPSHESVKTREEAASSGILLSQIKLASRAPEITEKLSGRVAYSRLALDAILRHSSEGGKRVLIAIPCYNEGLAIGSLVLKAQKFGDQVLVVNDGSTDDTARVADAAGAKVISHENNKGYGGALRTCFEYARINDFETMVIMDGDGQHDPASIPRLIEALETEHANVVIGSRFIGDHKLKVPIKRRIGMKVLDVMTSHAGDISITDSQSGFRAYDRKAIEKINISTIDMGAGSEILTQVSSHKLKIAEVPIDVRYDLKDTSSQNFITHGLDVLSSIVWSMAYRRPLIYICIPGVVLTMCSVGCAVFMLGLYSQSEYFSIPLAMLVGIFGILGVFSIMAGLILNIVTRLKQV